MILLSATACALQLSPFAAATLKPSSQVAVLRVSIGRPLLPHAEFSVMFSGSQFDPAQNDVRVVFLGPNGYAAERLAFFEDGNWQARFNPPRAGAYSARLRRNGQDTFEPEVLLEVAQKSLRPRGYLRPSAATENRISDASGNRIFPVGLDYGGSWVVAGDMEPPLARARKAGFGWIRVRVAPASDPFVSPDPQSAVPGSLDLPALYRWEWLFVACGETGTRALVGLFDGRSFAEGEAWGRHPWNVANGGFLSDPAGMFADPQARSAAKAWIREAVARFGDLPEVGAWELMADVRATAAVASGRWAEVADWHRDLGGYLRHLDPHKRAIVADAAPERVQSWQELDFGFRSDLDAADAGESPAKTLAKVGPLRAGQSLSDWMDGAWGELRKNPAGLFLPAAAMRPGDSRNGIAVSLAAAISNCSLGDRVAAKPREVMSQAPWTASGIGETDWVIVRATAQSGSQPEPIRLSGLTLRDGPFSLTQWGLDSGETRRDAIRVENFAPSEPISPVGRDVLLCFRREGAPKR